MRILKRKEQTINMIFKLIGVAIILLLGLFVFESNAYAGHCAPGSDGIGRCGVACSSNSQCATNIGYACTGGWCWKAPYSPAVGVYMCDHTWAMDGGCSTPDPCQGNTNCGQCGNPSCCNVSGPNATTNRTPANGVTKINNDVAFSWDAISGWGSGCPTSASYNLELKIKVGADCSAGNYNTVYSGGATSYTYTDLNWGTNYCWRVRTSNGGASNYSAATEFTTNFPPVALNFQVLPNTANKCVPDISGRFGELKTDNPITISFDIYDEDNDFAAGVNEIKYSSLSVSGTISANPQASEGAVHVSMYNTWGGRISDFETGRNTGIYRYALGDVSSSVNPWGPTSTFGSLDAISQGLMNLNGNNIENSHVEVIDNKTFRVYYQAKFNEGFPNYVSGTSSALLPIRNMIVSGPQDNSFEISNDALPTDSYLYRHLGNWKVDTQIPNTASPTPYNWNAGTRTFQVDWTARDAQSRMKSITGYCWEDAPGNIVISGPSGSFTVASSEPANGSPSNCQASYTYTEASGTIDGGGTATYTITSGANDVTGLKFKTVAEDIACNQNVVEDSVTADPWIITFGGNAQAQEFSFNIPETSLDYVIRSGGSLATVFANPTGPTYLSTNLVGTGLASPQLPIRNSRQQAVITNYVDANANPPLSTGNVDYYNYLLNIAKTNIPSQLETVTASIVSTKGSMSELSATPQINTAKYYQTTGDITFNSGFVCDTRTVFFIDGNVTINPDFKNNASPKNGCIIISSGNISVNAGTFRSTSSTVSSAYFDRIDAFLIANGTFLTSPDNPFLGPAGDGLGINGSVVANNMSLNRDLGVFNNLAKPAEAIIYDARFSNIPELRAALGINSYSIREKGYSD